MDRKAYDKATELLKSALTAESDIEAKQSIRALLGDALAGAQEFDGAAVIYREFLASATSDNERVLGVTRLAAVLTLQKRFAEAEAVLQQPGLIGEDPSQRQAIQYAQLRLWQSQPGRLNEVASNLQAQVEADSADLSSLELLGTIYLKVQRDYDKAKPVYEQLLTADPTNSSVQNDLIVIYQETRDYDKARGVYESYLENHPEQADGIRFQIASLYIQSGQGEAAVAYAEKHLAGAHASSEQKVLESKIYEFCGRFDESLRLLKEAASDETNVEEKINLRFKEADLLVRQSKYAEAEILIRQLLKENSSNKDIRARANEEIIRLYRVQGRMKDLIL